MNGSLRTVMLIDDSDADNFFHEMLITRSGLSPCIRVFEWAEKALSWFLEHPAHDIDLVLLDINMPRMNGFEFLDAFHRLPVEHQGDVRICMLSSSPLDTDRERALSYARVKDFIVKPLDGSRLLQLAGTRTINR